MVADVSEDHDYLCYLCFNLISNIVGRSCSCCSMICKLLKIYQSVRKLGI